MHVSTNDTILLYYIYHHSTLCLISQNVYIFLFRINMSLLIRCWQIFWMDLILMPISRKSYKDFVVEDNYSSSYVVVSVNINFDKPEIFFILKF